MCTTLSVRQLLVPVSSCDAQTELRSGVPVSNRLRFNIISEESEIETSRQVYDQVLSENRNKIFGPASKQARQVKAVLDRLIPVSGLDNLDWEIFVIDDRSQKNAFVIPG